MQDRSVDGLLNGVGKIKRKVERDGTFHVKVVSDGHGDSFVLGVGLQAFFT